MNIGRRHDISSIRNRIYVSGILPETRKCQIVSYFQTFGTILDVQLVGSNLVAAPSGHRPRQRNAGKRKHYCILVCQDPGCYRAILECSDHFIGRTRVFCDPHLTGKKLYDQNSQNNNKRAFIRKIPLRAEIDQILELVEEISGPVESYQDFINDIGPTSKHYSISITFPTSEVRDRFYQRWKNEGLLVMGEYVLVEKYIEKIQKRNQQRNTSTNGGAQLLSNWTYPHDSACINHLKNKDTSLSIEKEGTLKRNGVQSTATRTLDNLIPRFEAVWKQPKPTTKDYHKLAYTPHSGEAHPYHNIRLNVLKPSNNVNYSYRT